MKKLIVYSLSIILIASFSNCNQTTKKEAEKAKIVAERAKAEADSLRQVMALNKQLEDERASSLGLPTTSIKETGKLNPVDEGQVVSSFRSFRKELLDIIKNKDVDGLMGILDNEIKADFSNSTGKEAFKKKWNLDTKASKSLVWQELRNVVELGGTFENKDKTVFTAPYIFTSFPQGFDPKTYGAITGAGVRIRNAPSRGAKQIGTLSFDVVRLLPDNTPISEVVAKEKHVWKKIQMPNSQTIGYVFGKYLRTPNDYRASFERKGDTWKMFYFVKGN